jgi:hypothetical protein
MGLASQLRIRLMLFIPRICNKPYCKYQEYSGIMFVLSSKVKKEVCLVNGKDSNDSEDMLFTFILEK